MICAAVGVDHEVCGDVRADRLYQNVNPRSGPAPADRVADQPTHRITGSDRSGANQLLAFLQRNVGHLSRRGIDLIERAGRPGVVLDRVDELLALRLHARGGVCRSHPIPGAGWLGAARGAGGGSPRFGLRLHCRSGPCIDDHWSRL